MPIWILFVFVVACALLGYRVIAAVPPLLHTPLMSGMNALSGITLLVALRALSDESSVSPLAISAVVLATANVVGGFWVTERMLRMFQRPVREGEGR